MLKRLKHNLLNVPGWRTNRHIVVIESDDWGSIRMPSRKVYDTLLKNGIRVDRCHYCSNDSIATETDLELLFETLESVKDKNGCHAVLTANAVVANPDFQKIRLSDFNQYHFISINHNIPEMDGCRKALELWKQGNEKGLFRIQSHGREHLNVARWMRTLKENYPETRLAFDNGVYGISTNISSENRKSFLPALDFDTDQQEQAVNQIITDGLRIFEDIFGYRSVSFIAPNYTWGQSMEKTLNDNQVRFIQGNQLNRYASTADEKFPLRLRRTGHRNRYGQIDLARNATFEPSENPRKDWVDSCMAQIKTAFRWKHPAVISAHRVNFVGRINPENRNSSLRAFRKLLHEIVKTWPDVEFMSSDTLGAAIER